MLKLREFITQIRESKTAEEERSLINKESAEIRNLDKQKEEAYKIRSLTKCIFMTILGYHTEFIQMTCINLLASHSFTNKRFAYLGLSVIMDENSDLLLLTSNTIKTDLDNNNEFIVGCALRAIGEICSVDMCRDSVTQVIRCLSNSNPYIRKKAYLTLTKIINKCPELVESVGSKLSLVFEEKNNGVLMCGLQLAINIFKVDKSFIKQNKKYLKNLLVLLKQLSNCNYSSNYDFEGTTDPFLQVKLLEIISIFYQDSSTIDEDLHNLLASISTNTDSTKNPGQSILYELVKTIYTIKGNNDLKDLCTNILSKFFSSNDVSLRFIALSLLVEIAKNDLKKAQDNKNSVFDCIKNEEDLLIKRISLDLTYKLVDKTTIRYFVTECLNLLITGEIDFKTEITTKITQMLHNYSPSLKWEINTLVKMLCLAGNSVTEEVVSSVINLIIKTEQLHKYSMYKLFLAMKSNLGQEGLIKVGLYCLGELSTSILGKTVITDIETYKFDEDEIKNLINEIIIRKTAMETKQILINTFFKLYQKDEISAEFKEFLYKLIEKETFSYNSEIQGRAIEYIRFFNSGNNNAKQAIKKPIPTKKSIENEPIQKNIIDRDFDDEDDVFYKQLVEGVLPQEPKKQNINQLFLIDNFPIDNSQDVVFPENNQIPTTNNGIKDNNNTNNIPLLLDL